MPRLSEFDDYDECLQGAPDGNVASYCLVRVVLKPDNSSELWKQIDTFSRDRNRHYNHALLDRGLCVEGCRNLIRNLPNSTRQQLRVEKFPIDFPYSFGDFKTSTRDRERYGNLVDICLNYQLNQSYQLRAYTEIELCEKKSDSMDVDLLDWSFLLIFALLIALTLISTLFDKSINYKMSTAHYKQPLDSKKKTALASFSILRNWYRLAARSHSSKSKELRFLNFFRVITMILVILGHAALLTIISPSSNSITLELLYHDIGSMILTSGTQITQTFMFISGLLMALFIVDMVDVKKVKLGVVHWIKFILLRYLRLTPVYAFVVLLHATWLIKLRDGPIWLRHHEKEMSNCRENWWTNLLYVNNHIESNHPCVQQAWYLGAEFQCFVIGLTVLLIAVRIRRFMISIVSIATLACLIGQGTVIYFEKLEGTFPITLESQRFVLQKDRLYLMAYIPFYINVGNYMCGVLTALIFLHQTENNYNPVKSKWFRISWYLSFPVIVTSLLVHYIFYVYEFSKPALWIAIYFPVTKNLWGVWMGFVFLGLVNNIMPVTRRIMNHPVFEVLGRLSYSTYLAHAFVMRLIFLNTRGPAHFSEFTMISHTCASVLLSCFMGLFLSFILELPVSCLLKLAFEGTKNDHLKLGIVYWRVSGPSGTARSSPGWMRMARWH
ncbi:nose resistant to fluoxetine protein 6-like [Uranotaenia lowii]|uniref:nose resistant to fluoxetine protein 6-like n=1 Tax=Uranotaenia lowii TaxID=190385 RepID=UPI00247B1EE6|nr:nose resistant to fluoxetine protein 6-like [Uranotaenia lowii]